MLNSLHSYILIVCISYLNIFMCFHLNYDDTTFMGIIVKNSQDILNSTLFNPNLTISESCRATLNDTYIYGDYAYEVFYKTSEDSSKNKNDVGSYNDCINNNLISNDNKTYYGINFNYYIISVQKEQRVNHTDSRFESGTYLFGVCLIEGCNELEYTEIFYDINFKLENPFTLNCKDDVKMYDVDESKKKELSWHLLLDLIPFYLLIIQILFVIFPEIPALLFRKCFRKKGTSKYERSDKEKLFLNGKDEYSRSSINGKASDENISQEDERKNPSMFSNFKRTKISNDSGNILMGNINKNLLFKFKSAFDIVDNSEELFSKKSTSINNESGLHFLKGIRGICMIYLIIGNTFIALFNSPAKIYEEKTFINLHEKAAYSSLFFGIRYAPRILFSCSGFSFIYKLLSYLAEKEEATTYYAEINEEPKSIKFGVFFKFIMKQFHKYLLYVFVIVFFKYSLYVIIFFTSEVGPLSIFYKIKELDTVNFSSVLGHIFLYMPYNYRTDSSSLMDFFWVSMNEITFFIASTLIIYVFYTRKWRFDIFFLILFILLLTTKYILFFLPITFFYPTVFYYQSLFGYFFRNPLYNYTYFIIGIFFGLVNYSIQNNFTKIKTAVLSKKNYLLSAIKFIKLINGRSKFFYMIWSLFGFLFIILCSFTFEISLKLIGKNDNLIPFYENVYLNLWLLVDIELVVFITNFVAVCLFLMGENIFYNLISHSIWISFSRSYFTYILVNNPLIICFLYQSQSRIQLNILNIFFYGFTFWLLNLMLCWISYITFEFPWKRINKLIMEDNKDDDQLETNENTHRIE